MRAASAGLSLTVHVMLGAAIVWGTLDARAPQASKPRIAVLAPYRATPGPAAPQVPRIDAAVSLPHVPFPTIVSGVATPLGPVVDPRSPAGAILAPAQRWQGDGDLVDLSLVEEPPVILAGPLPVYPDLLRQAGIRGRVVLEGVVDTTGRMEARSVSVVSTTHPGFVAAAQRALTATLFRPGRMLGRAVRVRVRVPIEFRLAGRR